MAHENVVQLGILAGGKNGTFGCSVAAVLFFRYIRKHEPPSEFFPSLFVSLSRDAAGRYSGPECVELLPTQAA